MGEKMDSEREAFEKWANDNGYKLFDLVPDDDRYNRKRRGQYKDHMVELAWEVWQARAHITQPAQAVDVEKVREVIAELREADSPSPLRFREWADKLTAALPNANGKEG